MTLDDLLGSRGCRPKDRHVLVTSVRRQMPGKTWKGRGGVARPPLQAQWHSFLAVDVVTFTGRSGGKDRCGITDGGGRESRRCRHRRRNKGCFSEASDSTVVFARLRRRRQQRRRCRRRQSKRYVSLIKDDVATSPRCQFMVTITDQTGSAAKEGGFAV